MLTQEKSDILYPQNNQLSNKTPQRERAWVEIDVNALAHNIQQIKSLLSPETQLMAVVKADAYGHGAVRIASIALEKGCYSLAIATLEEGIQLRQAGIEAPILLLSSINTVSEIETIANWQLQPTMCNSQQALLFSQVMASTNQTLPVHLKIDTGMSRLGTLWENAVEFVEFVNDLPNLEIASIYSHFATADSPDTTMMMEQNRRFTKVIEQIKARIPISHLPCLHMANSAATLTDSNLHYDLVRVGLALYGLYPAPHLRKIIELKPVLKVKARITQIKTIPANTGVSYGYQFVSKEEMRIAVVAIGYADGVPRNLSNNLSVIIKGQLVPQIGAITMDKLIVDLSSMSEAEVGDVVTLIGQDGEYQITADDWANSLNTISWEILCGFKHRLPRVSI